MRPYTRGELPEGVRAKLAETLSVTITNIEIGYPTDHAWSIDWIRFHTCLGRFDDTYIQGRKMGLARIIAPEGLMNNELKSKALVEVAKNLRDAICAEDDGDGTGIFVICVEVPDGHWTVGGRPLP